MDKSNRRCWLWVTRPEYYDSIESSGGWSCHKDTMRGDLAFLWRAKGKSDISHLLQVESDAEPDETWGSSCQYKILYEFKNPVNMKDLRDNDAYFRDWGAYSGNFQRNSFEIPLKHWEELNQIALIKNPEYAKIYDQISIKDSLKAEINLQLGLETVLSKYIDVSTREPFGKQNEIWATFEALHKNLLHLESIKKYLSLNVSWSVGQGKWAKIPWIAFFDERETEGPQEGVYCTYLFREDMSGVYLTLGQGVAKLEKEMKPSDTRTQLRNRAVKIRERCKELPAQGFSLDNDIDLHTNQPLGKDFEYSTIAYKLYETESIPNDESLGNDLDAILFAYNKYIGHKPPMDITKIHQLKDLLKNKPQIILAGPPGTSKTYMAFQLIALLGDEDYRMDINPMNFIFSAPYMQFDSTANTVHTGIKVVWDIVQFHPSYGYEDFVSGIEADSKDGVLNFNRRKRIFIQMVEAAKANPSIKYVLIIDEINRGILGRIFGELILTLEYRDLGVKLLGQSERMSIPGNLYLVGTMNTADRNISLVDHALRRRFLIVQCLPEGNLLDRYLKGNSTLDESKRALISKIFQAVQGAFYNENNTGYERDQRGYMGDYAIGHTYFMVKDFGEFWTNLRFQVIPLLEEYRKEGILTEEHLKRTSQSVLQLKLDPTQGENVGCLLNWCNSIGDRYS